MYENNLVYEEIDIIYFVEVFKGFKFSYYIEFKMRLLYCLI